MTESKTTFTKSFKIFGLTIWQTQEITESDSLLDQEEFTVKLIEKITPTIKSSVSDQIVKEIQSTLSQ